MRIQAAALALISAIALVEARGSDLLTDGGFEFATSVPGWTLEEAIFDQGTMQRRNFGDINAAQQQTFGPQAGVQALWLRAFVGGQAAGPDTLTSASFSQTVPVDAGESYTFSGWSRFEFLYSGSVTTLDSGGPLGAAPSPTANTFELAFLDGAGGVLGSPVTLDVRADRTAQSGGPGFNDWIQHTLVGAAPAGAVSARVTADADQMLWNSGQPNESAFYDSFSLRAGSDEETELLINPGLEETPERFAPEFTIVEDPGGNFGIPGEVVQATDFANRPESGGQLGLWIRSFEGSEADPAGAIVSQTVAASASGDYTFSAWSNFQDNYSGGVDDFSTETSLELAFLDSSGEAIGDPLTLDVRADRESQSGGVANDGEWYEHTLSGAAPAGTESVRVLASAQGLVTNPAGGAQSAFIDDFLLIGPGGAVPGDYNGDGLVDAADYTVWRDNLGTAGPAGDGTGDDLLGTPDGDVDAFDYQFWAANFGAGAASASESAAAAAPEPGGACLLAAALCWGAWSSRRHARPRTNFQAACSGGGSLFF